MAQALITINSVAGSNLNLPINTLVTLSNVNAGGETTYTWVILDQPPGPTDALNATNIQSPTFTPKKEGTYLIKLVVNQNLVDETSDTVDAAILQLKTLQRVPAAGETEEASVTRGWAGAAGSVFQLVDSFVADPGVLVGVAGAAGLTRGTALIATGTSVIMSGLPGQETLPLFTKALATQAGNMSDLDGPVYVLEGGVDGNTAPASGALIRARFNGLFTGNAGAGVAGNVAYVSTVGTIVCDGTFGGFPRPMGRALTTATPHDVMIDGLRSIPGIVTYEFGAATISNNRFLFPSSSVGTADTTERRIAMLFPGTIIGATVYARVTASNDNDINININGSAVTAVTIPASSNVGGLFGGTLHSFAALDTMSTSVSVGGGSVPSDVTVTIYTVPARFKAS